MRPEPRHIAASEETRAPGAPGWSVLPLMAVMLVLYAVSRYDYSIFHTLVEGFSLMVAASVFMVVFNTRRLLDNHYLLYIGIGLVSFLILGVPHTLGYKGVALFPGFDNDLPTQAFTSQRLFLAATFLIAPLFVKRRLSARVAIAAYAVLSALVVASLLWWRNFPSMFVEGQGLTPLKMNLEFVISAMFLIAGAHLMRYRASFEPRLLHMINAALACFIASEVAFTLYNTPFGMANLAGHFFQVGAFWFIYRAVVVASLVTPYSTLFRGLARSEQGLRAANWQLSAIASISDIAMSSLESEDLADNMLSRLRETMGADAAVLLMADGDLLTVFSANGVSDRGFTTPVGVGFAGGIAQNRRPDYVRDAQTDPKVISAGLKSQGIRSMLGVPLLIGDTLLGVVHVDWFTIHEYSESEMRALEIVGDRFSLALRNARLFQAEHHVAEVLQESLLALPDQVGGVRFSSAYRAALQAARVGGDFYDVFELEHCHIGVVVGDVSGKGLEAAVLTSLVRNTVRAHAVERDKSPADVMRLTNSVVDKSTDDATFVTVFFGVIDLLNMRLTYCNAGHTTGALVRTDGVVDRLVATSSIVGAFADAEFQSATVDIGTADRLVLYTDGVTEARRNGDLFGEERLFELLSALSDRDVEDITSGISEAVREYTGGIFSDDIALLALEVGGATCDPEE